MTYRFSQWDPNDREKFIGTPEQWAEAQDAMEKILKHLNVPYTIGIGEAAFYGPKLDIQIKNVYGKEDTLITLQVDQMLAELFGMEYVDVDGQKRRPYIIHRTSLGCYERTLALLIEKYAGAFPLWLAPEQVRVLPISERLHDAAQAVTDRLKAAGLRVEIDRRNEKIGYKIREAQVQKVPYMLAVSYTHLDVYKRQERTRQGSSGGAGRTAPFRRQGQAGDRQPGAVSGLQIPAFEDILYP